MKSPGRSGARRTPLSEFYVNDGIVRLHLAPNEIVTRVYLPESSAGWRGSYQKLRVRGSIDYPLAGVAVALKNALRAAWKMRASPSLPSILRRSW